MFYKDMHVLTFCTDICGLQMSYLNDVGDKIIHLSIHPFFSSLSGSQGGWKPNNHFGFLADHFEKNIFSFLFVC